MADTKSEIIAAEAAELAPSIITEEVKTRFLMFAQVSRHTERAYLGGIERFARFCQVNGAARPTREHVLAWVKSMEAEGLSVGTRHLRLVGVRTLFQWMEAEGLYHDVTKCVKVPKADPNHKRGAMTAEQVGRLVGHACGYTELETLRNRAMLALMAVNALRVIEVARADVGDFNADTLTLRIQGKMRSEKSDVVKLVPEVGAMISAYLLTRGELADTDPLFASHSKKLQGGRLTTWTVSQAAKKAMAAAGIDGRKFCAHSLRHSAITLAYEGGGKNAVELQDFARHRSFDTTRVYMHEVDSLANGCSRRVADAIFKGAEAAA